jgi:cell envelope opacity-associated protein A
MPGVVRTELTSGVPDTRGLKPVEPSDIADAIIEAIETGRYEVYVPRSISGIYRATRLLPLRATDAMMKVVGADKALSHAIDSPERLAYKQRVELSGGDRQPQLPSGRDAD